ncbi:superoxide dismutase [Candidatus Methylacidiphilum fumarolicum]|uniref:Superoxide dismutase n=2 Tax=Candidatus Methylacidiphilum fumarolicum TaxID=591154 RepID=I0JZZ3_METFB|nr:superoxide dismutase [Candidatus Methylacidiphilum fumarolicum]MBW6415163.1 superoxide dismutase [Candidatus Methylacidiphilum fumarolicum]TFE65958.1 superoxide dismutase [Candidatus Methylacidiphilum fumarolicum]TFE72691.1 superoxide dismutase [Candidatus Methylacidiphilum fumarolicum]TFE73156.1 superoxide dismutase [Candidatus Methylacidiphilum fumarolicum]TFE77558.1 superoxide dismutase [Candidatus Methylacidiphilum fumarolicum]
MAYQLPPLPYALDALEPHINTMTMDCHYNGHHKAYVQNLNKALADYPDFQRKRPEELLMALDSIPQNIRTAVRNNGGGHVNHSFFWRIMAPNAGGKPTGKLYEDILSQFGSFEAFQEKFEAAGLARFGSGWVWLVVNKEGKLEVLSTPNQDNPLSDGNQPFFGCDVWEHAYYLKYQFRRGEWLKAFWNVVNWKAVEEFYSQALAKNLSFCP